MRKPSKALSVFMPIILMLGLCSGVAYADDLGAASIAGEVVDGALVTETIDASDGILQEGGLIKEAPKRTGMTLGVQSEPDIVGFEAALFAAAASWDGVSESTTIDVSQYNIPTNQLETLYAAFLNRNGQFFYLDKYYGYYPDVEVAPIFVLKYDNVSYNENSLTAFSAAVERALSGIESGWNDEQKALYLHDWIVTHCEYDLTYEKNSAYNTLVEGLSVCHGYALAYDYLLSRVGVDCDVITSVAINHAWNLVTINGATYYVDCTWDDPTGIDFEAYCGHTYMLRSKGVFGHDVKDGTEEPAHDWLDTSGTNVYESTTVASSTDYDSAYWSDVITAIPHVGSKWAYVNSTVNNQDEATTVYVHDYATGSNSEIASVTPGIWLAWDGSGYYPARFAHLVSNGESFLVTTPTSVIKIEDDGSKSEVYQLSAQEAAAGYVYGLLFDSQTDKCHFELGTAINETATGTGEFAFAPTHTTSIASATVTIAPQTYAGTALIPEASVKLGDQTLTPETDYDVIYPDNCINAGNYTVTVVGRNAYRGSVSSTFVVSPKPVTVTAQPASKTYGEDDPALVAAVDGLVGTDTVQYAVTRASGEDAGAYAITASGNTSQGNYAVSFAPSTFTISPLSIEGAALVLSESSYVYNGGIQKPSVATVGGKALAEGADYTLAYSNASSTGVGSYDVWVEGKGSCSGESAKATYVIGPKPVTVTAQPASKTYGEDDPALAAAVDGLVGTDTVLYEVSRASGEDAGTYAITASGNTSQGNYVVTYKLGSFKINPAPLSSVSVEAIAAQAYTGNALRPAPMLKAGSVVLKKDTDFSVSYKGNTNAGTATVTITGMGNYSGSTSTTFTITPASINGASLALSSNSFTYNGQVQAPAVKTVGGKALQVGVDYTVAYSNANSKAAGSYTVKVTGKGNYAGTASAGYKIDHASIGGASIAGIADKTFNGQALTQQPVVKLGALTLQNGIDYTLSYQNNTNAGTATVVIAGAGNFTGTVSKGFTIAKAANPMKVTAKSPKVKASKKKAVTVKKSAAYKFSKKAVGKVTYKRVAKGSAKQLSKVNAKTGAITVKAGTPKRTYKVKVKITAKGNANYSAASKTITVKVKVK